MTRILDDACDPTGEQFAAMTHEQKLAAFAAKEIEVATDDAAWAIIQAAVKLYNARRAKIGKGPVSLSIPEETS